MAMRGRLCCSEDFHLHDLTYSSPRGFGLSFRWGWNCLERTKCFSESVHSKKNAPGSIPNSTSGVLEQVTTYRDFRVDLTHLNEFSVRPINCAFYHCTLEKLLCLINVPR